jgi:hypothetical protein
MSKFDNRRMLIEAEIKAGRVVRNEERDDSVP